MNNRKFYKAFSIHGETEKRTYVFWEHMDRSLFTENEISSLRDYYPYELYVAESKNGILEPAVLHEGTLNKYSGRENGIIKLYEQDDYDLPFRVVGFCTGAGPVT